MNRRTVLPLALLAVAAACGPTPTDAALARPAAAQRDDSPPPPPPPGDSTTAAGDTTGRGGGGTIGSGT